MRLAQSRSACCSSLSGPAKPLAEFVHSIQAGISSTPQNAYQDSAGNDPIGASASEPTTPFGFLPHPTGAPRSTALANCHVIQRSRITERVLQDGSLDGGKDGGQLTPFKMAPNFEITDLRNLPMHKRPCGARSAGHMGYAVAVDTANGPDWTPPCSRSPMPTSSVEKS
jgi:hypothetical protein